MSVIRLDIGRTTYEVPTQVEIEKYITSVPSLLPKEFIFDLDRLAFPEIALKICRTNGEMYKREFLVWSQVKQSSYCLPCRMQWHTTCVVSTRSALASPVG